MNEMVGIEEITVGQRARTDLGDLTELINSIEEFGLLHPIVITLDRKLIAGGRRLEACRKLGMIRVPVSVAEHIADAVDLLKAERDENTCRKDMTVSEKLAIGARIEELKRPEAQERIKATQAKPGQQAARHSESLGSSRSGGAQNGAAKRNRNNETASLAAEAVGMSRTTYSYAKRIKKQAEDPTRPASVREAAHEALAELDATGKVSTVYEAFMAKTEAPVAEPQVAPPTVSPLIDKRGRRYPQRSQRKAITEGMAALSGLCSGLATVTELDESTDAEEVALWQSDLNQALRVLRSLNNTFKEHLNGKR
jgi:ParB-like chromosome segregation protein Spo0J